MSTARKIFAKNWARSFAAGLVENAEPAWQQEQSGLTDEELAIAQNELQKIAAKIQATVTSTD
ncbi:hypothetical protein [Azonexus hydrophilus]|uniref:Uncharacterized protein n=1 Tax=Azonexus hydrophilus TaxID=418702 RepID=A0ABZ2XKV6_9RHOO